MQNQKNQLCLYKNSKYVITKIKSTTSFTVAPRKMEHLGKNRTGVWFMCLKLLNDHERGFKMPNEIERHIMFM